MATRLVDLTQPLTPGMAVLPGDPPLTASPHLTHAIDGFSLTTLCMSTHTGTHVDAPFHLLPEGATLDRFPLSRFVGQARVLDVRRPAVTAIDIGDLDGPWSGVDMCLLWTGWDAHYGTETMVDHPFLTPEAAATLRDAGMRLVGTDAPSLDPILGPHYPVHELLLGADVLLVENLCHLDELGPGPVSCAFLPLALVGADGSPVRAAAWVEE